MVWRKPAREATMAALLKVRDYVRRVSRRTVGALLAFMLLLSLAAILPAEAQTYTVLHEFTGRPDRDGANPLSGLLLDAAGNLFGTTSSGGTGMDNGYGVVFEIDAAGNETILHRFYENAVGEYPVSAVVEDLRGRLYGTTPYSYRSSGSVYKLGTNGVLTTLYEFTGGTDGGDPWAGVVRDAEDNLYGVTRGGGGTVPGCEATDGCGTVFKVSPCGMLTVLHRFVTADGVLPQGTLVRDEDGTLYGTSDTTVYKLDPSGNLTVLYTFDTGGYGAWAGLVKDAAGNLFGTTIQGGAHGWGEVYEINHEGKETTLYNFTGGSDGGYASGSLVLDPSGDLYGTTTFGGDLTCNYGGAPGCGTVFKLDTTGKYTVLHTFTGADGAQPYAGLVRDAAGNLYGTTSVGGTSPAYLCGQAGSCGVVFKLTP
jgi:uncharacterized repeat protein (TIGR03803 family)